MMATGTAPRIYTACLASYNAGKLHGAWIDADQDADTIREAIAEMLKASPEAGAEEWAIHDHEGFGGYPISEMESIDNVARIAELIDEHGAIFGELLAHKGGTDYLDNAEETMRDGYGGEWDSLEDYAANLAEDTGALKEVPESLQRYIDFAAWGSDMEYGGDIFTIEAGGKVHVFDNNV